MEKRIESRRAGRNKGKRRRRGKRNRLFSRSGERGSLVSTVVWGAAYRLWNGK